MYRHRNTPFNDEEGNKASNTDTYIIQYTKFPFTDPLKLNSPGSHFVHYRNGVPRPSYKNIKIGQYIIILLKEENSFKGERYGDQQR